MPMVLHVRVVAGSGGGPDKTIARSAAPTIAAGYRCAAAYIHPRNDPGILALREQAQRLGCEFHAIPEVGPLDPRTFSQLLRLTRQLNVALWHGHDYKSNLLGLLIARFHRMKLLTTVHGWTWHSWRTRLYHHLDNWCLRRYDRVLCVSPSHLDHCARLGIPAARVVNHPNGIDPHEYTFHTPRARRSPMTLGVVARLSGEKGVDRALRAFAAVHRDHRDTQMHLVGDGPERAHLQTLAEGLNIAHAVHFRGWRSDPRKCYEEFDVLLLPSRTEGLPNALLEAMATGVPVAATRVGAVSQVLDEGRCGVLLDGDETDWPRQIAPLLVSDAIRQEYARRARLRVLEHYTFAKRMEREIEVCDRLLGVDRAALPLRRAA